MSELGTQVRYLLPIGVLKREIRRRKRNSDWRTTRKWDRAVCWLCGRTEHTALALRSLSHFTVLGVT